MRDQKLFVAAFKMVPRVITRHIRNNQIKEIPDKKVQNKTNNGKLMWYTATAP